MSQLPGRRSIKGGKSSVRECLQAFSPPSPSSLPSFFVFFVNFSPALYYLNAWNRLLAEPIKRYVRWRTQVFKSRGLSASVSFLPLPLPPLSFFGSCFISRAAKTENPVPRSFFAPKPSGNACYAGYADQCF